MIRLTKINGEMILVNPYQIECIEVIPESKIIMMNGIFHIVREDSFHVQKLISEFYRDIYNNSERKEHF